MANSVTIQDTQISSGDLIKIYQSTKDDKDKEKTQVFEGRVISIKNRRPNQTITVRKIGVGNIGIEKIYPVELPTISKVEVVKKYPSRRAKLYYLRNQTKK